MVVVVNGKAETITALCVAIVKLLFSRDGRNGSVCCQKVMYDAKEADNDTASRSTRATNARVVNAARVVKIVKVVKVVMSLPMESNPLMVTNLQWKARC